MARRIAQAGGLFTPADRELAEAAAVLHDVGYAPDVVASGFHPVDGARYLEEQGFPDRLCALVARHSCAHSEAALREVSADLARWEDEKTAVRDALWWADMTTTPDGGLTTVADRIEEIRERYGPDDLVTASIGQARPELAAAVERTEERLRAVGLGQVVK
ncbi:HD domain-containing protein [Saccharothrix violaceirubra]|uniref:HD domain-containing protein n=1 Tax=Saccharothrix violaceirubra TaxID=413306 RepID=A0A7W7WZ53_9PSEU|nr:HD domain-containing protein [Saccharothrix violaceirubra]MBB4968656.1 hypothetical protein [Saccharothrix violaceirubra]